SQFGDEGKGKIVDLMTKDYDMIVRFQGGDNAGHTVVVNGKKYKLHLTPSGVLQDARLLIGPGTVVNPQTLSQEFDMLSDNGINVDEHKLGIDAKTSIIMPYHVELDGLRESARTDKIGTTKRGIEIRAGILDDILCNNCQKNIRVIPHSMSVKCPYCGTIMKYHPLTYDQ
ncbi:MAG: adenylosuccinate synthase, partial [Candidatus Methanomarinus sp.]